MVKRLLERGWDAERVRQLFNLIDWLMELPKDLKIEFHEQVARYEEEKRMPFINTFEELGMERGRLEAIETILEHRFPDASSQLMSEIRQVHDYEHLKKILLAAATAVSPEELAEVVGQRRGRP